MWNDQPAAGSVYLNPKSQHASPGSEFAVNIEVAPASYGVSASELQLSFDARALEVVKIKEGGLLGPSPLKGTEKINNEAGAITYALARVGATTAPGAQGVLATISFKIKANAKGTLNLEIAKVGLANEKFEDVKGLQSQGATVIVD